MRGRVIRQEYRIPPDTPVETAIRIFALAPYERGISHEIDGFIGIIPREGCVCERFEASTLEEVAAYLARSWNENPRKILDWLRACNRNQH